MAYNILIKRLKGSPSQKFIQDSAIKGFKNRGIADAWVEIAVVGKEKMRSINYRFRSIDQPTDVLSFPLDDMPRSKGEARHFGTIFLCSDIIIKNARENDKTFEEEFDFILRHGIDHLLGFHHK